MRHSSLTLALALALGGTSFAATADDRDREIALLKEQLAALQAQVQALEERTRAQPQPQPQPIADAAPAQPPVAQVAEAAKVDTEGGIEVTSADENFSFSLGGRIHFDAYAFDRDQEDVTGTTEFRRARLSLEGEVLGWQYEIEHDFANGGSLAGFESFYIAREAFGGLVTIGHFKPYRSMDELTSSNDLVMMERPFSTATGLYSDRQQQQGVGYLRAGDSYTFGATVFNLRNASGPRNEGVGGAARVTFAPINSDDSTMHLGASVSYENTNKGSADIVAEVDYAGRRGPSQEIAVVSGESGDTLTVVGLEAAGAFGPLFFQSEYARARFAQPLESDQDVQTWYVMGSWMLNGGRRPYEADIGVFDSPEVAGRGLWELTARYDTIENKDVPGLEVHSTILGLNYYINPNVRLMFNYTRGDNEFTGDKTNQYALRTQFAF